MYNEEYCEKLDKLLTNEDFAAAAVKAASPEELKELFAQNGLETEDEMVQAMFDKLRRIEAGEELSEEDLELVAGGKISWRRIVYSAAAGAIVAVSISTLNPKVIALGVAAAVSLTVYGVKKDLGRK